jgi:CO/xanthine dehydrogenase FAD-binding subunit
MIIEYHKPENMPEALSLLARSCPITIPMGGGTRLSRFLLSEFAVVDLQYLGLNKIAFEDNLVKIGATVTLETLVTTELLSAALRRSAFLEGGINIRNSATIAGLIVAGDGRSPLLATLLAMDARLVWQPGNDVISLGDWLALREHRQRNKLLTEIHLPSNLEVGIETVARTPVDTPIVCAVVSRWPASNRHRIVVGGFGKIPVLVSDGQDDVVSAVQAVKNACSESDDNWASAAYRQSTAAVLVNRLLAQENKS